MIKYNDQEFIKLALQYQYISQADVEKCLEIQKKLPGQVGIGEIMKLHKYLNDTSYNIIMTLLKYKSGPVIKPTDTQQLGSEAKLKDRRFAEIALREDLVSEAQLVECVEWQKELQKQGETRSLSSLFLRKGYLSERDVQFIEDGGTPTTSQYDKDAVLSYMQARQAEKNQPPVTSIKHYMPLLVARGGNRDGSVYPITKEEVTIGRVPGADVRLEDEFVSRIHCKIVYHKETGEWELIDMMSSHGVAINGARISRRHTLKPSDIIRIGETLLEFKIKEI